MPGRRFSMSLTDNLAHIEPSTDAAEVEDADAIVHRRDLAAQRLADYIKATVSAAPDLTGEQRAKLATLLRGGDDG